MNHSALLWDRAGDLARYETSVLCLLAGSELKSINDFLFQSQVDNINLFKVKVCSDLQKPF